MQPKLCKTQISVILYHMGEEEENAPLTTKFLQCFFFPFYFSIIVFPWDLQRSQAGERLETLQTSPTSTPLKGVHGRVAGVRQMPFRKVKTDQCKSVTTVLRQLSLHTEKP